MKTAICTMVVGELYERIWEHSEPTFRRYAEKIGAELRVVTEIADRDPCAISYNRLGIMREALKEFDRVAWIDADILIRFDSPNIFEVVPSDSIGMFDEGIIHERCSAKRLWTRQTGMPAPEWTEDPVYYNAGVMVVSQEHRDIFFEPSQRIDNFYEQTLLNWRIHERKMKTHSLDYKFNRIHGASEITGEKFHDAYFVHFAGAFASASPVEANFQGFVWTANKFEEFRAQGFVPYIEKHIYVETAGALGDCVAAEPVVRYIKKEMFPKDFVVLKTDHVDVFAHLKGLDGLQILGPRQKLEVPPGEDTGFLKLFLYPQQRFMSGNQMKGVDFAAVIALKGQLPDAHRHVVLHPGEPIEHDLSKSILIHPGRSWQSKTFPKKYWDEIIQGLVSMGLSVAIIGKDVEACRGTVDVDATGCIDLRNKLSVLQLFTAIRTAPLLISNDSSPVHIAGAWENPCIMICSAKHPDYIFPTRDPKLNIAMGTPIQQGLIVGKVHDMDMDKCSQEAMDAALPLPRKVIAEACDQFKLRCMVRRSE